MESNNIKKLEKLIALSIEKLRLLRSQNDALREDLNRRKTDFDSIQVGGEKLKKQLARITELEKENKRLVSDQSQVRKKVGNILNELEKADFM